MQLRGIYAITDSNLLPGPALVEGVRQALEGGVKVLQYRDKQADPETRRQQALALKELCDGYNVPLLINDDIALCIACGAAGVHLGQCDLGVGRAREQLGPDAIIGVSCHNSLALAREAEQAGASYVAFGRFFPSRTKPGAPSASLETLQQARQELSLPLVAIGGVDADNGARLTAAGADMLAVIHYLFAGPDVMSRAVKLAELFR